MNFYKYIIFVFILFGLASVTTISAADSDSKLSSKTEPCELNMGMADWVPLQYIDESGNIVGLQIDFIKAIAAELGCSLTFTTGSWQEVVAGLKAGRIDFVPDATKTTERAKHAYFSIPYRRDTFAIYVRNDDKAKYADAEISDLKENQFKLALNKDFLYGNEIEAWQADKKYNRSIVYSKTTQHSFQRLLAGEIDGFIEDPYVMAYQFRSKHQANVVATLPIYIQSHTACFMFSKQRITPSFIERFNFAIEQVKQKSQFKISWFTL